jgi:hypothetical protein
MVQLHGPWCEPALTLLEGRGAPKQQIEQQGVV